MGTETFDIDEKITGYIIDLKNLPESVTSIESFDIKYTRSLLQAHLSNYRGSCTFWVTNRGKVYAGFSGNTYTKIDKDWVERPQTPDDLWDCIKNYFGQAYVDEMKPKQELKELRVFGKVTRTFRSNDDWRFARKVLDYGIER